MKGKNVACYATGNNTGSWSEYIIAKAKDCIINDNDIAEKQLACFLINPFTAYGLVDICKKRGAKAIAVNAASGSVAYIIRTLAKIENIETVNIVRTEENKKNLLQNGVKHVLNSSDENFNNDIHRIFRKLKVSVVIDAVGGEESGLMLESMEEGELVIYGGLSGKAINIDPMQIIFKKKIVTGFNLNDWFESLNPTRKKQISDYLSRLYKEKALDTKISKVFKFDDAKLALKYYIKNMSEGKILFTP